MRVFTPTGMVAHSLASLAVASHGLKYSILSRILTEHAKSGPVLRQTSFPFALKLPVLHGGKLQFQTPRFPQHGSLQQILCKQCLLM